MSEQFRGFPGTSRYTPVRFIGAGGMGAVYEVSDQATGGRLALKVMLAGGARRLLRFKQEFRVVAELHHRNLVRLFDLGQHEGQWFFTMELVHGLELTDVLLGEGSPGKASATDLAPMTDVPASLEATVADAPRVQRAPACDLDAFCPIVEQILDALDFLHGRGIVHRDLKPSNVLVDLDGVVRVLDFGLASRVDRAEAISEEGGVVGTLAFLSPEQCRGEPASAASDLYALGCVMFQLVCGELPFSGSPAQVLAARDQAPPRVEERVSGVYPALASIVYRLMAVDPAARPSSAEVRAALGARPSPSARREVSAEIFVGRQREMAILGGCLERAAGGQAQLALVTGPSGIGKSSLAARMVARARRLGFLCFGGRCYERERVPFVAFDRLMDELTLALQRWPPEALAPLRPSLRALARIFPALVLIAGDVDEDAGADPRELRQQAVLGFRHLVAHAQGQAPLCLVLDDLQWADEESVELLEALAGSAGRIMILGLFRSDALGADHPLARLLGAGSVPALSLAALGSAEVMALVETVIGGPVEPGVSEALASQTQGNPFLARRLAERLEGLGEADLRARLEAVGSAGDLLGEMLRPLSARAEQVLALAATAGGDVAASVVQEASGLGGGEFDLAASELLSARLVKAVPRRPEAAAVPEAWVLPYLDVYHDRIRELVYEGLDEARRRALHRSLALALEAHPAGRGRDAEALVRHWTEAGDHARRRRYAVEAAGQAAAKLAFVRAARLLQIALDDPEPGESPLVTAARWERAGDLLEHGGLHVDAARAYVEAQRRWEDAPSSHPERLASRLRLAGLSGANFLATSRVGEGRAAFAGGLALLGLPLDRPVPVRLAVLAGLEAQRRIAESLGRGGGAQGALAATEVRFFDLMVRAFIPLWPGPGAEAALRAELLGRRLDDHGVLVRSMAFGAGMGVLLGRCSAAQLERAHRRLDATDDLARRHDVPLGHEMVQLNRSLLWLATNTVRARRTCEAALEGLARRGLRDSFDGDVARGFYLYVLLHKGDDDDSLALAATEGRPGGNLVNAIVSGSHKVGILARRGLCDQAHRALQEVQGHLAGVPTSRLHQGLAAARATLLCAEGRFDEVLDGARATESAARESGAWAIGTDRSLWLMARTEASLGALARRGLSPGERRDARAAATWLVDRAVFDMGCLGHRALALLDGAEGRARAARASIHRALSLSSVNTHPYYRWLCLEAARDLGAFTQEDEAEAADLARAGRFVRAGGSS